MSKKNIIEFVAMDNQYFLLTVNGQEYRIRWEDCSSRLKKATASQRSHYEVSPSGYGIHWPEIDEDLAIAPLLQQSEILTVEMAH